MLLRGIERGELRPDANLDLIYDLLMGPLFMRSVVRGETLSPAMAEQMVDIVLSAFGSAEADKLRRASS
jgi:hypothetical protein